MNRADLPKFIEQLEISNDIYGRKMSDAGVLGFFDLLSDHPIGMVVDAIHSHMKNPEDGRFAPKPADIIYQIEGPRIGSEELLRLAMRNDTPVGAIANAGIGHWDLTHKTERELQSICAGMVHDIPNWRKKYLSGNLTESQIGMFNRRDIDCGAQFSPSSKQRPSDYKTLALVHSND